ncbi:MAG: 50S ribosomal protein L22 [Candidatus Zixiibacteriota bacterium]|nr:MAG: 50S ribosomal protein L22 [candidate division Zixibacteria bacterium]
MEARARVRYLRMSPKKMRRVAELIRGKPVEEALNILNYTPKIAAHHLAKTVKAAAANAIASVGTGKLKAEDLSVSRVVVDGGPIAKRVRFQSMGRAHRIHKRYCHLTVEVEGEPEEETPKAKTTRRKKQKAEKPEAVGKEADAGKKKVSRAKKAKARPKAKPEKAEKEKKAEDVELDDDSTNGIPAEAEDKNEEKNRSEE